MRLVDFLPCKMTYPFLVAARLLIAIGAYCLLRILIYAALNETKLIFNKEEKQCKASLF